MASLWNRCPHHGRTARGPTLAIDHRIAWSQVVLSSLARQTLTGGLMLRRRRPVNVDGEEKASHRLTGHPVNGKRSK